MSSPISSNEDAPSVETFDPSAPLPQDFEVRMMRALVKRLLQRLEDPKVEMSVTEMQLVRQLCEANAVSFASIRRGDFGETAQRVAEEEFPFDDEGRVVPIGGRG